MVDDGILQDFLVESAEIAEQLAARLLDLESRPDDAETVHAVFRAFHTIKGGAGFLDIPPVVELCHLAEELMGQVRGGRRAVDPPLMDLLLRAADALRAMLAALADGAAPERDSALIDGLRAALDDPRQPPAPATETEPAAETAPDPGGEDPVAAEFERLLAAAAQGVPEQMPAAGEAEAAAAAPPSGGGSDEISDEEFEQLLEQFHGGLPGAAGAEPASDAAAAAGGQTASADAPDVSGAEPAGPVPPAPTAGTAPARIEPTVRVETRRLDAIMDLVGELVLARNRIKALRSRLHSDELERAASELDVVTLRLQDAVMKTRMQPIGKVFQRFPRVARDLARTLGKRVRLVLEGEQTDLDKNLVEELADPLIHLVRNAIDHGIEAPEVRRTLGKPEEGMLRLAARHEGDHILIVVEDDGAGIDAERIRDKAIARGLVTREQAAQMTPEQLMQLIFAPGFSTRDTVSDVSGRGVGMDVVRSRIQQLGGQIQVRSRPGHGTRFLLQVPLTLAILPTLMVGVGSRSCALALGAVVEVLAARSAVLRRMDGAEVLDLRGALIPVVDLTQWAGEEPGEDRHLVIVQVGSERYALAVDAVRGREEVVVKPLGAMLQGLAGISGATITGDGSIALILDLPGVLTAAGVMR